MLAIGAVIGAGIFGAIGTAAAGQTGPSGEVVRYGAGPALIFSFLLLGAACALAALCYAELAAMIPQAGSAYAYAYATLGEVVAWIIGWDLILEYAVGNVAVAISWGDYFTTLTRGVGIDLPAWLTTGYRTALLSSNADVQALLETAPRIAGVPLLVNVPAFAIVMVITWLLLRGARESSTANNVGTLRRGGIDEHRRGELCPLCAERLHRYSPGRGNRVLCVHRLRCGVDSSRRDAQSAA
jgi:APA family basic amino acid/polyamine antiporter